MNQCNRLPSSQSPDLCLRQPTSEECRQIWASTAESWKDALTTALYITEAEYLSTVPLTENGGMTTWVLVDRNQPPNQRHILGSCETFRKQCLVSDEEGRVEEGVIHGVASVFCPPKIRRRGYGTRLMEELAKVLRGWQSDHGKSVGSILYSDIGKEFYARTGWAANPQNGHYIIPTVNTDATEPPPGGLHLISESEIGPLCQKDERMIYEALEMPSTTARKRVVVVPDLDHMLWHIRKEDFATRYMFGETPEAKGAMAGTPGKQVWAIWTHRFYEPLDPKNPETSSHQSRQFDEHAEDDGGNPLYILRLVVEGDETANKPFEGQARPYSKAYAEQESALRTVLLAARAEAAKWSLDHVALWNPSPLVHNFIRRSDLGATWVERQKLAIASTLWFEGGGDGDGDQDANPVLINNEHYAWC